jgi:hypothetical protein
VQDHNVGIILPHEVFSVLYHYKRPLFEKLFINSGENERWWTYCENAGGLAICNYMKYVYIYICACLYLFQGGLVKPYLKWKFRKLPGDVYSHAWLRQGQSGG